MRSTSLVEESWELLFNLSVIECAIQYLITSYLIVIINYSSYGVSICLVLAFVSVLSTFLHSLENPYQSLIALDLI